MGLFSYDNITREQCEEFSQISNYAQIYELYYMRGDNDKAAEYAAKIPNSINKLFTLCNHDLG